MQIRFATEKIPKLVVQMTIPSIIAMLVIIIYNIADTFFIGRLNNPLMLTAVSVASPIFMFLVTLGSLIGIGAAANIGRALGMGQVEKARQIGLFAVIAGLIAGIFIAVVVNLNLDFLATSLGAASDALTYTKDYMSIIAYSAPATILTGVMANVIRSEGSAKESMYGNILGTGLNVILDPILIFTLNFGVSGVAIATLISNIVATLYYLSYFYWFKNTKLTINIGEYKFDQQILSDVLLTGLPAALTNFLNSISIIFINNLLLEYGGNYQAAAGVSVKLLLVSNLVQVGISNGVLPVLSYCKGAGLSDRFKHVFRFALGYATVIAIVLTIGLYWFRSEILSSFTSVPEIVQIAKTMTALLLISAPFLPIFTLTIASLQAENKQRLASIIVVLRQGIIFIPLLFVMQKAIGEQGIILAQPISDYITYAICLVVLFLGMKKGGLVTND